MNQQNAIVLTGGGARAAYQVGAMRALYEITQKDKNLFEIITGNSAGAINAIYLGAHAKNWDIATSQLWDLWKSLVPQDIFDLGTLSIGQIGAKWISGTVFGGISKKGSQANYLLDTTPLASLLDSEVDFPQLNKEIKEGVIDGIALSATNYYSGSSVVYFNSCHEVNEWSRTDRFAIKSDIKREHVMASSAIPLFFPPQQIDQSYYGDGCIRQTTPLSPAIHLGAKRILAIGIRAPHSDQGMKMKALSPSPNPTIGQIAGMMMNAIFMDSLEADVERLSRINQTLYQIEETKRKEMFQELKPIPVMLLRPSKDLGAMTGDLSKELPATLRYLLKGIGVSGREGLDLLSYLAFDKSYTLPLMELGYADTFSQKEAILRFFEI
jgi:NTE family protein